MGTENHEEAFIAAVFGDTTGNLYAVDPVSGKQKWKESIGSGAILSPPAVANGTAFAGTSGGQGSARLAAVDVKSGGIVWNIEVPGDVEAAPVVLGDWVWVMASDGCLRAFTSAKGEQKKRLDVLHLSRGTRAEITGLVHRKGVLYATTSMGVGAVDVNRVEVLWGKENEYEFPYPAAVSEEAVFCARGDGEVRAFDAKTGSLLWNSDQCGVCNSQPQVVGGIVMFGSQGGFLFGIDTQSGKEKWSRSFPGAIHSFVFEAGNLFLIANALKGTVYRFDLRIVKETWEWQKVWEKPLTLGAESDPLLWGTEVIVTASDSRVYSFHRVNGAQRWEYRPANVSLGGAEIAAEVGELPASRTFDKCCWLGSHNAFANSEEGWMVGAQGRSIVEQLDAGVRMLMLDVWSCMSVFGSQVVYAHGDCTLTRAQMYPLSPWIRFEDSLRQIGEWLRRNPSEILTVALEQRVYDKVKLWGAIERSGVEPLIFFADRPNSGPGGSWEVGASGWPPLGWMRSADKRLVLFSDHIKGMGYEEDGLPYLWRWCVENAYGGASRNPNCNKRGESEEISRTDRLFIQNYQGSSWETWADYDEINESDLILSHVHICQVEHNRLPNVIAVDWAEFGNAGGPLRAVDKVNAALAGGTLQ